MQNENNNSDQNRPRVAPYSSLNITKRKVSFLIYILKCEDDLIFSILNNILMNNDLHLKKKKD